ncbi:MAG: signal peptide peptidase SppA [Mesorhizobium sp.]|nr:MAG: signal peptide peptidase SppA [Mesorhizobium sp.]
MVLAAALIAFSAWVYNDDFTGRAVDHIAKVKIEGTITEDEELIKRLETIRKSPTVKGVILSIDSPGGTTVGGESIYEEVRKLAGDKPVAAEVGTLAASAGYMIASAADHIVARKTSIVGSIGVVSASFGFPELMKKIGVERRVHTAGQNKAVLDPFKPEKKEDVERLKALQLEVHETFIDLVRERRGTKLKDDPDLFTGLFWTAKKGLELGLVDALGDMRSVLKTRFGDKTQLKLITAPRGLFGRFGLFGSRFSAPDIAAAVASGAIDAAEERALWARFGL